MSHPCPQVLLALALACALWIGTGCEKVKHFRDHQSVLEQVKAAKATRVSPHAIAIRHAIEQRNAVQVHWGGQRFVIPRRTDQIKRYPCNGCHTASKRRQAPRAANTAATQPGTTTQPDTNKQVVQPPSRPAPHAVATTRSHAFVATHGSILLKHAAAGVLQCRSCHSSQDMQKLRTPAGEHVSLNHSHQLCASCHQRQTNDWVGGSHGKRIGRWYGQRAIYTCTQCHNPHQPLLHFGKRWPKAYFTFPSQRARQRRGAKH